MPLERLACELKSKIESTWLKKKLTRKVKRKSRVNSRNYTFKRQRRRNHFVDLFGSQKISSLSHPYYRLGLGFLFFLFISPIKISFSELFRGFSRVFRLFWGVPMFQLLVNSAWTLAAVMNLKLQTQNFIAISVSLAVIHCVHRYQSCITMPSKHTNTSTKLMSLRERINKCNKRSIKVYRISTRWRFSFFILFYFFFDTATKCSL